MDPNGKRLRDWETLRTSSTAKFIRKNHKLAFGSNSVIFSHNAVSEILRVYTVSAEVAHSDPLTLFTDFSCSDSHLFQIFYSSFPIYSTILFLQGGAQRSSPVCGFPAARSGSGQAPTTAGTGMKCNRRQGKLQKVWKDEKRKNGIVEPLQISVVVLGYVLSVMAKPSALSERQRVCWRFWRFHRQVIS